MREDFETKYIDSNLYKIISLYNYLFYKPSSLAVINIIVFHAIIETNFRGQYVTNYIMMNFWLMN